MNWGKITILIAEDNDNNFNLIETYLKDTSITLLRGRTGADTIEIFQSHDKIDLILMDLRMPVMDGYEATRQIKKINENQIIIAQTAYADDKANAHEYGFSAYLSKPFNKQQLLEVISEFLS